MATAIRPYEKKRDRDPLASLWASCELTRPWNNPGRDIDRKLASDPENLLVLEKDGEIIGSVMVGYDGHRGWDQFLRGTSVAPATRVGSTTHSRGRATTTRSWLRQGQSASALLERPCPRLLLPNRICRRRCCQSRQAA